MVRSYLFMDTRKILIINFEILNFQQLLRWELRNLPQQLAESVLEI